MSYCVSNLIGIRTGGVFSGDTVMEALEKRIAVVVGQIQSEKDEYWSDIDITPESLPRCLSRELSAHKGSYVVIAGVFNFWTWPKSIEFSRRLSKEFGTEVMHCCWNEETGERNFEVFLDGGPLDGVGENPISSVMRRTT